MCLAASSAAKSISASVPSAMLRWKLQHKERVTWADLKDHPFISLQGQFTERLLRDVSLKPYNEVTFMTTALAMVSANLGVTVCLPYAAAMVKLYKLQMRALHEPELTRRFFVYTKTGRSLSPAAESFIAFLFQFVKTHEWNLSGARTEQKLVGLL